MEVRKSDPEPPNFLQNSFELFGLLPRNGQLVLPIVIGPVNQQSHRTGDGGAHLVRKQFDAMKVAVIQVD